MKRKQIYLDEKTIETIEKISDKNNVSQSKIIRDAIKNYINEQYTKGEAKNPLLELIGLGESRTTKGSTDHDLHIYGGLTNE